jgi:3-dehydroquinate dehydratase type I
MAAKASEVVWVHQGGSDEAVSYLTALAAQLDYTEGSMRLLDTGDIAADTSIIQNLLSSDSYYFMFDSDDDAADDMIRKLCRYTIFVDRSSATGDTTAARYKKLVNRINWSEKKTKYMNGGSGAESSVEIDAGEWSSFISLTAPHVSDLAPLIDRLRIGTDALELRVDLLDDTSPKSLHQQIALLRDMCPLPIVFTVRTRAQIGQYPDLEFDNILALLQEGARAGCEWMDIEASLPDRTIKGIASFIKAHYSKTSSMLGSLHTRETVSAEELKEMYKKCDLLGYADMLKVAINYVLSTSVYLSLYRGLFGGAVAGDMAAIFQLVLSARATSP